jgi:hypothetical protein
LADRRPRRAADGRWAAFEAGLIVTRQNGKGSVLEALELAGLFLFDEQLILHSAHEFKTAQEAFRRVLALIQGTADLDRLVQRVRTSHGEEGIELRTGQRLRFVARSTGSGRGFSGDRVILDEAYNLSPDAMAALLPTMSARPNPQLVYTSSAPLDRDESEVLRQFCRRARAQARGEQPATVAYAEFCAEDTDDDADPATWRRANPGCPHRISVEHIARSAPRSTSTGSAGNGSGSGMTARTASRSCRPSSGRRAGVKASGSTGRRRSLWTSARTGSGRRSPPPASRPRTRPGSPSRWSTPAGGPAGWSTGRSSCWSAGAASCRWRRVRRRRR